MPDSDAHRRSSQVPTLPNSDYLLLEEVAALSRASMHTVRRWVQSGRLPSSRPARRRLVRRCDLEAFLARRQRGVSAAGAAPR
jgi:excisionase family DNA binding protein